MKLGGWATLTKKTNESIIGRINDAFGGKAAAAVTKKELQVWLNDLAGVGKSESYIKKARTHLRGIFSEAVEEGLLSHDVARWLKVPRTKRTAGTFLTIPECVRLLSACDKQDHLILRVFLVCGLRPGELFALRVDDAESGKLRIDQTIYEGRIKQYGKTDHSFGWVSVSAALESELREWIAFRGIEEFPDELLFVSTRGRPIHAGNYLRRTLSKIANRANIAGLSHQILRRTTGTHFQKHGTIKDAQGHLRHTDPETTLRYYQQIIPESLRTAVDSWDTELFGTATGISQ